VLHLGNVAFTAIDRDVCTVSDVSGHALSRAAALLEVEAAALRSALTHRCVARLSRTSGVCLGVRVRVRVRVGACGRVRVCVRERERVSVCVSANVLFRSRCELLSSRCAMCARVGVCARQRGAGCVALSAHVCMCVRVL
jgi:hypothetical protein